MSHHLRRATGRAPHRPRSAGKSLISWQDPGECGSRGRPKAAAGESPSSMMSRPFSYFCGLPATPNWQALGGRIDPGIVRWLDALAASRANRAPLMRRPDRRGRPPLTICASPLADVRHRTSALLTLYASDSGQVSLRALLGNARQQSTNFCFPIPAMTTKGPDRRELPGLGPSRNGLRVHPEHCGDLGRRK